MKSHYLVLALMISPMFSIMVEKPAQAQSALIQITDCQDLQNIKNNLAGNYQLANDIDCSNFQNFQPIGGESVTTFFTGSFNGNEHSINNLSINANGVYYAGLFSGVNYPATISNVTLNSFNVQGAYFLGALAGDIAYANISNVRVTQSKITSIDTNAYPLIYGNVGGLAGEYYNGSLSNSAVINTVVTGVGSQITGVGGLTGQIGAHTISASFVS